MNCDTIRKDYLAILIIFVVIILLLTIFLAISLVSNKDEIVSTNDSINRIVNQNTNLLRAQNETSRQLTQEFQKYSTKLTENQANMNALRQNLEMIRRTTLVQQPLPVSSRPVKQEVIIEDVRVSPTRIHHRESPKRRESILETPVRMNIYEDIVAYNPCATGRRNLYMIPEDHCRGKKSLAGTRLEKISIPEFGKTEVIMAFAPYLDGLLVASTKPDIHEYRMSYVSSSNKGKNRYNVRWSEIVPMSFTEVIRLKKDTDYIYYGLHDQKVYQMTVHEGHPHIQIHQVNVDFPIKSLAGSPDDLLMSLTNAQDDSSRIFKYLSKTGLTPIHTLPNQVISVGHSSKGPYEVISAGNETPILMGKEQIALDNVKTAIFTNEGILGLTDANLQYIDFCKEIPNQGIYFMGKEGYEQDIYL